MEITEAIESILKKETLFTGFARKALNSQNELIEFTNFFMDQYKETESNKERLIKTFGENVCECVRLWHKSMGVAQTNHLHLLIDPNK